MTTRPIVRAAASSECQARGFSSDMHHFSSCSPGTLATRLVESSLLIMPAADDRAASIDEFGLDLLRNHAGRVTAGQQLPHRLATAGAEIERPIVHVHADETVGLGPGRGRGHIAGLGQRLVAMLEPVSNALLAATGSRRGCSAPRSLRMALAPSGSGKPVSSTTTPQVDDQL